MKPEQISHTAAFIAIKFYGLTRTEPFRGWFEEDVIRFYEKIVHELPRPLNGYYHSLKKSWVRKFFIVSEGLLLPGDLMHIILRKYLVGRWVDECLNDDFEQLLVLGAGFDHQAARQAARGIPSLEIDMPKMAAFKRNFLLQQYAGQPHPAIRQHDFSREHGGLIQSLRETLDNRRNTVVIAEGFFDYLRNEQTEDILRELGFWFKGRTTLISTHFALDELPIIRRAVFKTGVALVGEKIMSDLDKPGYLKLLRRVGFTKQDIMSPGDMEQELLYPAGVNYPAMKGFYLISAEA